MEVCGVSFKDNGKIYNFFSSDIELALNDHVIVETEKGEQFGKIVQLNEKEVFNNLKYVIRKATDADYNKYLKNQADCKQALIEARLMAEKSGLNMQIIDSSYTFDRKQLIFNFIADERIDFRELVKQLASKFKTRIELHQIGVRDKAKEVNGLGQCGRTLCCATFLNRIETISMNMAKNQNIALNPAKINGSCGRLLCCLSFEDSQYVDCRKDLPNIGDVIKIENKSGKVISVDILNQKYKISIDGEVREIILTNGKCNK